MNEKAYTLIELIIVMAIVVMLSGISIFALGGVRESARDGQRRSELEEIRTALELYKSDCNIYPAGAGDFNGVFGPVFDDFDGVCPGGGGARDYLSEIPVDPQGADYYYGQIDAHHYELCATLEDPPVGGGDCTATGGGGNFRVTNP